MKPATPGPESGKVIDKSASMIGPRTRTNWVGLVCDATSATVLAARGNAADATVLARQQIDFDPDELQQQGRIAGLESFVAEHGLAGCEANVIFAGSAIIVQKLTMPPLSARDRRRAVQTRLTSYADGRELAIDIALDRQSSRREAVHLLAAGVERSLSRGIYRACRRAGLRVRAMTALAGAFGPCSDVGVVVQLVLGERTTTIQLFDRGRLIACRDVLLGRRDFVLAYQRPILTENGPLILSAAEADALAQNVGIPVGREDEVHPGISATQLWPTLNPVLQKLLHEVEQSLAHSRLEEPCSASLSLLGLPALPGLAEFLITELHLEGPPVQPDRVEAYYLAALAASSPGGLSLDLRPPEEQFGARLTRPALAAGLCALLIILCNSVAPREARARLAELQPLVAQLQTQLAYARQERADAQHTRDELAARLQRDKRLTRILPVDVPAVGPLKAVFRSLPAGMEVLEVRLRAADLPAVLELGAAYEGRLAASVVAARWARELSDSVFFSGARVTGVSGSGGGDPAVVQIQAVLRGG